MKYLLESHDEAFDTAGPWPDYRHYFRASTLDEARDHVRNQYVGRVSFRTCHAGGIYVAVDGKEVGELRVCT